MTKWLSRSGVIFRSRDERERIKRKRKPEERLSDEELRSAVNDYQNGQTLAEIGRKFNSSKTYIKRLLTRNGVLIRSGLRDRYDFLRLPLDHGAFDNAKESSEASYWAGFLLADGSISDGGIISLSVAEIDKEHIYKFKDFLKSGHKIHRNTTSGYQGSAQIRFAVLSKHMALSLAKYGIKPRKSLTAEVSGGMEFNIDFWRGVIDGDGCLYTYHQRKENRKYPHIGLCGSRRTMEQFVNFVERLIGYRGSIQPNGKKCWKVTVPNTHALKLIKLLYYDGCCALARKQNKAKELLDEFGDRLSKLQIL